jgi:DNA-binding NarL/FixJ family response regulator
MNKKKIGVFLVDDHQIVRDGIKALLLDAPEINISGEASNGKELLERISSSNTDIILMDISLPDVSGIELTKQICKNYPEIKVLILSMYTQEDFIVNAIAAGAKGYLPKNTTRHELLKAINEINDGNEYYSDTVSKIILENYISNARRAKDPEPIKKDLAFKKEEDVLTSREKQILQMVVEGHSNQHIADKLFISIRTVESHKNHIMQKLGIKSVVELIKFAIRNNIAGI